ncbi:MAG TPA: aldehyde reductase [Pseudonocardiaceae bacterium]|jgi:dihydroflavonol-4-reductase
MTTSELVVVTGSSGFVGAHTIVRLLNAGYQVRTTVRSSRREADVRAMVKEGGADAALSVVEADLTADAGWAEALAGSDAVLHVASPFPATDPENEDDLIIPAREGTLRVLRTARAAGVRRAVVTSSFAAIGYGHPGKGPFTEADWTDLAGDDVTAYIKSKTLAERAAWDFVASDEGRGLELSVVNPVGIFGPVLGADYASSVELIGQILTGALPGTPAMQFGIVDVRDVADLLVRVLRSPEAIGERFLATSGEVLTTEEIALLLRERLGAVASQARIADDGPGMRLREADSAKAKRMLGWSPRSAEETVVATGESLVRFGLVG